MAAMYMLTNGLLPSIAVIKGLSMLIGASGSRRLRLLGAHGRVTTGDATHTTRQPTSAEATTAGAVDDDQWFDVEKSWPSLAEDPNDTQMIRDQTKYLARLAKISAIPECRIINLARQGSTSLTYAYTALLRGLAISFPSPLDVTVNFLQLHLLLHQSL